MMNTPAVSPIAADFTSSQLTYIRPSTIKPAQLFANWGLKVSMFAIAMMQIMIPRAIDNPVITKLVNTAFSLYLVLHTTRIRKLEGKKSLGLSLPIVLYI